MELGLNLSPHVISTIEALPPGERRAVRAALQREYVDGIDPREGLSPFEALLYSIIRFYVERDRVRGLAL